MSALQSDRQFEAKVAAESYCRTMARLHGEHVSYMASCSAMSNDEYKRMVKVRKLISEMLRLAVFTSVPYIRLDCYELELMNKLPTGRTLSWRSIHHHVAAWCCIPCLPQGVSAAVKTLSHSVVTDVMAAPTSGTIKLKRAVLEQVTKVSY